MGLHACFIMYFHDIHHSRQCFIMWKKQKTPWPESTSELYQPSDRRLSEKLVPTFVGRGCHVVSVTDPYNRILCFLDCSRYVLFQITPQLYSRSQADLFQTHYFSENLVALGIKPGPVDL
jgi:hypothetical protein